MPRSPHPYVVWRDGRPRFSPSPTLREQGHAGRDLRHDDGRWYSKGEAVDWSSTFVKDLEKARSAVKAAERATARRPSSAALSGGQRAAASGQAVRTYTVAKLFHDWQRSPKWTPGEHRAYPENTRRDYRQKMRVIESQHPLIWNAPVDVLIPGDIVTMYEEIWAARGLATAVGAVRILSVAISWAIRRSRIKRQTNPCKELGMEAPPPRLRIATRQEFEALVAAADAIGRPEVGDMCHLGVWTGQRPADRRALLEAPELVKGRRIFRQSKTGAIVAVRDTPQLRARLKAAAARRAAARAQALLKAGPDERAEVERRFAHAVLDERSWQPFGKYDYPKIFAAVRDEATKTCPTLADFTDADLRDTAVTWMANGGSTVPEIIAVTGHTLESATRILKHYLAVNPEMADTAIGKMLAWYDDQAL